MVIKIKNQIILILKHQPNHNLISSSADGQIILYNEYPKYKDYNTFLTVNGNLIKRFKTIEDNEIKKGNVIMVNIYED